MAMQPEYYPGDSYEEYLRMLAEMGNPTDVFARSLSPFTRPQSIPSFGAIPGFQYNDYLGADPTRGLRLSSFKKDSPKAQKLDNPGATFPLNQTIEEDPITVLRRNTDRARNYPRDFSEMFNPSLNPEGDIGRYVPNKPAVSRSAKVQPPAQGPARPASDTSAAPKTPAVQAQSAPSQGGGLLDVDMDFFDDPTRMGLLQAGLGLMSAPRYSTNPNDVTLSSALARGLGGFVQGYGGTKKRLSDAEQDRLDQEFKRSQMELDRMYKMALTDESAARAAREQANITRQYNEDRQAEQRKREQIQTIMELQQGNATTLAQLNNLSAEKVNELYEGVVAPSQETKQRQELISQIERGDNLTPDQKKILVEYAQNEESKYKDVIAMRDDYAAKNRGPEQVSTAAFENWLGTQTELTDIERNLVLSEVQRSGDTDSGFASVQKIMNLKKSQRGDQPKDADTMSGTIILREPQSLANYRPEDYPGYQATKSKDRVLLKPMTADQLKAMNDKGAAAQAIDAYLQELEKIPGNSLELKYKALVEDDSLSPLRSKFIHAIMKLKDAYGLGVLSGNDYDLLESALNDPTKILTIRNKENFIKTVRQTGQQAYRSYAGDATLFNYNPLTYYNQYIANSYQLPSTLANPVNQEQARKNQALQGTTEDPDAYLLEPRP
jgi:hypothetical protein